MRISDWSSDVCSSDLWKSTTRRPPCPMPTACRPCQNRAIAQTSENTMGFLQGKRALITGIASQRSIATGIADAMHRQGAELALTYQTEKLRTRVEDAAKEYGSNIVLPLDAASDEQIEACRHELGKHWTDGFDILVHCIP